MVYKHNPSYAGLMVCTNTLPARGDSLFDENRHNKQLLTLEILK